MKSPKVYKHYFFRLLAITTCLFLLVNQFMPHSTKHTFPDSIAVEANKALSYYPELKNVSIEFKFKKTIKKSTMQAQPKFGSLFRTKNKRSYVVLISKKIKISGKEFKTKDIPSDVMTGWLGHELGHIMDYQNKTNLELFWFGVNYLLFDKGIIKAERTADSFAVRSGMGNFILETKNFILNHADIDEDYKMRIKRYYLSPEEIMQMIQESDTKK